MENASKALLIAGEVLIAILVLTFGIFIFANIKNISINYENTRTIQEAQKENTKFTKYLNEKLTAQEVVTIINMLKEYNTEMETDAKIKIDDTEYSVDTFNTIIFIQDNSSKSIVTEKDGVEITTIEAQKFLCKEIKYDNTTGRIEGIYFTKDE